MSEHYEFTVKVQHRDDGFGAHWSVEVHDGSGYIATADAPHIDLALRMAVPYIANCCEPDPFAGLFSKTSAAAVASPAAGGAPGLGGPRPGATTSERSDA